MGLLRSTPALRRSSRLLWAVLGILVLFPPVSGLGAETDDPDLERAVQNPVLWSHFRTVARDSRSYYDSFGRKHYREHPALDSHAEILIEGFLRRVSRQSLELVSAGERLAETKRHRAAGGQAKELDLVLRDLEKAAGNLRGTLVRVYFSLNENSGFAKAGRAQEFDVDELTHLVFSTYQSVHDYVFQGQPTVTVHQLKNEKHARLSSPDPGDGEATARAVIWRLAFGSTYPKTPRSASISFEC